MTRVIPLMTRLREEWSKLVTKQNDLLKTPDFAKRVTYRREQLMLEGYNQVEAEALARAELLFSDLKGDVEELGQRIAENARESTKQLTLVLPHKTDHTHPDPSCFVPNCPPCLVRQRREKHKVHQKCGLVFDSECSICIDGKEDEVTEPEINRLAQLEAKRDAGEKLSRRERRALRELEGKLEQEERAKASPAATPSTPASMPPPAFTPTKFYPFELERFRAEIDVLASVNDLAFVAPAIADLRKFLDTRVGDLYQLAGLGRDGKPLPKPEPAPEAPKALIHSSVCVCNACEWEWRNKVKQQAEVPVVYCKRHTQGCSQNLHTCELVWWDGTPYRKEAQKKLDPVQKGRNLTLLPKPKEPEKVTVIESYSGPRAGTKYEVTDYEADDTRTYRFKCMKGPDGRDTSKEDHLWYDTLDAKPWCPTCDGKPRYLQAKPLTKEQQEAYNKGQKKEGDNGAAST